MRAVESHRADLAMSQSPLIVIETQFAVPLI